MYSRCKLFVFAIFSCYYKAGDKNAFKYFISYLNCYFITSIFVVLSCPFVSSRRLTVSRAQSFCCCRCLLLLLRRSSPRRSHYLEGGGWVVGGTWRGGWVVAWAVALLLLLLLLCLLCLLVRLPALLLLALLAGDVALLAVAVACCCRCLLCCCLLAAGLRVPVAQPNSCQHFTFRLLVKGWAAWLDAFASLQGMLSLWWLVHRHHGTASSTGLAVTWG